MIFCGDIIDYGLPDEARLFAKELSAAVVKIPVLQYVRKENDHATKGSHDSTGGTHP
jgi:hypothetical protein